MFSQQGHVLCSVCGSSMKIATIDYRSPGEMEVHYVCEPCDRSRVILIGNQECRDHQAA